MAIDKELLRKSFALFVACEPNLTHHFYEVLFARHPALRKLFSRSPMQVQERVFAETIAALVEHIDDVAHLENVLYPLGAKHVEYGATEEKYEWVREALLTTFRHVGCAVWTDELATAWRDAYDLMAKMMLEGAARAKPGGP
jgi:hemoglobin-like flavoprotein